MADGQVVFEITADGKRAIASVQDVTKAIQTEAKKWDKATDDATDGMGNSFTSMLKKVGGAISAAAIAKKVLDIGKACVDAASDLAEVQNVVDVTFGESSREIDRWAKNAGEKFGLTEAAAKRYASTIGAMMKSSGVSGSEVTAMSKDLAGLAADMASFYNMDFDTAFDKIKSGISGITMPLKSLGIDMSVSSLNAFALAEGMDKTYNEMSNGEQMLLRYRYLMKVTADAQGDFARTSDNFANATRKVESELTTAGATLGKVFLPIVEQALSAFNTFMDIILDDSWRTVLDDFADIDAELRKEEVSIAKTRQEVESLVGVMGEMFIPSSEQASAAFMFDTIGDSAQDSAEKMKSLGEEVARIFANHGIGDSTTSMLKQLGYSTEEIANKNDLWLETCRRLVETIPGLSSIINTETGAIDGGVAAVEEYVKAWEEGQKKIAFMRAQERRRKALEEKYAELPGLEIDMMVAKDAEKGAKAALDEMLSQYGITYSKIVQMAKSAALVVSEDKYQMLSQLSSVRKGSFVAGQAASAGGIANETLSLLMDLAAAYHSAHTQATEAETVFKRQNDAYVEGLRILEEGDRVIEEMGDETVETFRQAADAEKDFWKDTKYSAEAAATAAETALSSLAEYADRVQASVQSAVDSVVHGFTRIKSPVGELETQRDKLIEEQLALDTSAKDYQTRWEEIERKIREINGQIREYKPAGMMEGLQSQLAFMGEYTKNLEAAQKMGLSSEFLASLSDGSVDSAEYLAQLVANPEQAREVDALWRKVQEEKQKFVAALTDSQLEGDATYQSLVETAREAINELDMYGAANEAGASTVKGIADGIRANIPEVRSAVDEIKEIFEGLAAAMSLPGISFGGFGGIPIPGNNAGGKGLDGSKRTIDGDFAVGLNYVPFDGFLASLHAGEGILTEQENRVWQRFKAGGSGIDYETMGGVVRDNIGGNVYLDGRVVGSVISDQQGKAFRQLKRSGWSG